MDGFSLFALIICASMAGTSMFPPGDAPQGSARLLALGTAALVLLPAFLLLCSARPDRLVSAVQNRPVLTAVYRVLTAVLCLCFVVRCSYMLTLYAGMIELYLLPRTPSLAVISALLATSYIIARSDTDRLPGVSGIIILCSALPAAALFAAGLYRSDYGEWLILTQPDAGNVPGLIAPCAMCLSGFECAFFFIGGTERRGARRALTAGFAVSCLLAALSYLLCAGILTVEGSGHMNYPLVETARVINIGGVAFTDRFDLLLMVISIALLPSHTGIALHCAAECLTVVSAEAGKRFAGWLAVPAGIVAWLGQYAQFNEALRTAAMACYMFTVLAALPALCILSRSGSAAKKKGA